MCFNCEKARVYIRLVTYPIKKEFVTSRWVDDNNLANPSDRVHFWRSTSFIRRLENLRSKYHRRRFRRGNIQLQWVAHLSVSWCVFIIRVHVHFCSLTLTVITQEPHFDHLLYLLTDLYWYNCFCFMNLKIMFFFVFFQKNVSLERNSILAQVILASEFDPNTGKPISKRVQCGMRIGVLLMVVRIFLLFMKV